MQSTLHRRRQAPSKDKRSWDRAEDLRLMELVTLHGTTKWSVVADELRSRSGKQCRERYHNHLDPTVKKGGWSKEEDELILSLQKEYGNAWAKITSFLPGRTDNAVKNRYWSATRSAARKAKQCDRGGSRPNINETKSVPNDEPQLVSESELSAPPSPLQKPMSKRRPPSAPKKFALHSLKVNIPKIVPVDYMSDEDIKDSFSDWDALPSLSASISQYELNKPAEVTPSSDAGSDPKKRTHSASNLLEMHDFFDFEHFEEEPLVVPGVY
ncbi:hypothetical protein TrST_g3614 [Triparma strigata]|uniref:Uncharacterized protein n=1 Tax=Triparma strigata TaxID=1606541 RepID=A0A9W7EP42_9STRA|nr:hypothetical protein TrST_g3614 [Triparma strigata]